MSNASLTVAKYIEQQLAICRKPQTDIARELGYPNPNIITMFKNGKTKIPLGKAIPLARAIEVDPLFMLKLVMNEYYSDVYSELESMISPEKLLTEAEKTALEVVRAGSKGINIDWSLEQNRRPLLETIVKVAECESSKNEASVAKYNSLPNNLRSR